MSKTTTKAKAKNKVFWDFIMMVSYTRNAIGEVIRAYSKAPGVEAMKQVEEDGFVL